MPLSLTLLRIDNVSHLQHVKKTLFNPLPRVCYATEVSQHAGSPRLICGV